MGPRRFVALAVVPLVVLCACHRAPAGPEPSLRFAKGAVFARETPSYFPPGFITRSWWLDGSLDDTWRAAEAELTQDGWTVRTRKAKTIFLKKGRSALLLESSFSGNHRAVDPQSPPWTYIELDAPPQEAGG